MSHEIGIAWKIKVKTEDVEIEVVGMTPQGTMEMFKELEKKYLKEQ